MPRIPSEHPSGWLLPSGSELTGLLWAWTQGGSCYQEKSRKKRASGGGACSVLCHYGSKSGIATLPPIELCVCWAHPVFPRRHGPAGSAASSLGALGCIISLLCTSAAATLRLTIISALQSSRGFSGICLIKASCCNYHRCPCFHSCLRHCSKFCCCHQTAQEGGLGSRATCRRLRGWVCQF